MRRTATRWLLGSATLVALDILVITHSRSAAQENPPTRSNIANPAETLRAAAQKLVDEVVPRVDEARQSERKIEELRLAKIQLENALRRSMMRLEAAKIAETEYVEGTYPQELQTADGEEALAKSDLERARDRLEWARHMMSKGGLSQSAFLDEKYALQKAEFALKQAITKRSVLQKYTRDKEFTERHENVRRAEAQVLENQARLKGLPDQEAEAQRGAKNSALQDSETKTLLLLDEAMTLLDAHKPDDARPKLDEAARLWRESQGRRDERRFQQAKQRISALAAEARRRTER